MSLQTKRVERAGLIRTRGLIKSAPCMLALALFAAQLAGASAIAASQARPVAGEEYAVTMSYETSSEGDGSSGSSSGHDTIIERVIAVTDAGVELEYDLARDASAEDRKRQWDFPARVLLPPQAPMQLLNRDEMETRIDAWLKAAEWPREVCGRWIFTWNVFQIRCDPQSVLKTIRAFDLRSADLRDGASYEEAGARGPGTLVREAAAGKGDRFVTVMDLDPEAVRRSRAESDVVIGEIIRKPVTLEEALRQRAKESVSGTISVAFETDGTGNPLRRTKVIKLETKHPDGSSESETKTETVERRRLPR